MGIGERLKQLRKALKLTQTEIANALLLDQSQYAKYERELNLPNTQFYEKLIAFCNVNVNWLLTGKGSMFAEISDKKDVEVIYSENVQLKQENQRLREDAIAEVSKIIYQSKKIKKKK